MSFRVCGLRFMCCLPFECQTPRVEADDKCGAGLHGRSAIWSRVPAGESVERARAPCFCDITSFIMTFFILGRYLSSTSIDSCTQQLPNPNVLSTWLCLKIKICKYFRDFFGGDIYLWYSCGEFLNNTHVILLTNTEKYVFCYVNQCSYSYK